MLESFQISNFRLFQHLEVKRLNRVNLIVGKNNSGKSTFLEAVELYVSNADPQVILNLVQSRQETWSSQAQTQSQNFKHNYVRHLFFGHKLPQIDERGIVLGEVFSKAKLHICIAAYQIKDDDPETIIKIRISDSQLNLLDENLSNIEFVLVAEESDKTRRLFSLERDGRNIRVYGSRIPYGEFKFKSMYQIVSTENMSNRKLAALWDLTSLTNLETDVISALRLIDERVSGIAFVEDISQKRSENNRIPLLKIEGINEPLPLKSMGDGMTRLLHIIVS